MAQNLDRVRLLGRSELRALDDRLIAHASLLRKTDGNECARLVIYELIHPRWEKMPNRRTQARTAPTP